jgi:hypothetical protein
MKQIIKRKERIVKQTWWQRYNYEIKATIFMFAVIFVLISVSYLQSSKFDPERDVCEKYNYQYCSVPCKIILDGKDITNDCSSWHPKSFCEKCADSWTDKCEQECVCEKYEEVKEEKYNVDFLYEAEDWDRKDRRFSDCYYNHFLDTILTYDDEVVIKLCGNHTYFSKKMFEALRNYSNSKQIITKQGNCLQAREKTECEKTGEDCSLKKGDTFTIKWTCVGCSFVEEGRE